LTRVAGADGCRAGWICAVRDIQTGEIRSRLFDSAAALILQSPRPRVLAIDIPIGLPAAGARSCDVEARKRLGPRRNSVFPSPVRPALGAMSHLEASRLTTEADGRRVSVQAWNIFAKIREVDAVFASRPNLQRRVREVHPELAFAALNDGRAMENPKKTRAGREERRRALTRRFGDVFVTFRARYRVADVAHDDILDALANLASAERILRGDAITLPDRPPRDATGLWMEIVY
jgi:predicted RNase H-like nuclease